MKGVFKMTNLKAVRKEKKITQAELSKRSGVNLRLIQDYEQGHKSINNAMALSVYKIAQALECDISEILELKTDGGE